MWAQCLLKLHATCPLEVRSPAVAAATLTLALDLSIDAAVTQICTHRPAARIDNEEDATSGGRHPSVLQKLREARY